MSMDFSALGLTKEDIVERIVDKAVAELFGGDYVENITFNVEQAIQARVDEEARKVVDKIGDEIVAPKVEAFIEGLSFQETSGWGEPKTPPKSWREMLVERAENYLVEKVDMNGKTQKQESYNWRAHTTRIAYLVEKHIQFEIERAMKAALADANSKIAGGFVSAVKMSLAEILAKLKIEAKV